MQDNSYAIYQVKDGQDYHLLRFASMDELRRDGQRLRRDGLQVDHKGFCKCPFHADKNPSMKTDKRYHCFGCNADGDVIAFAARLFSLSPKDAAMKLAADFGISYDKSHALVR